MIKKIVFVAASVVLLVSPFVASADWLGNGVNFDIYKIASGGTVSFTLQRGQTARGSALGGNYVSMTLGKVGFDGTICADVTVNVATQNYRYTSTPCFKNDTTTVIGLHDGNGKSALIAVRPHVNIGRSVSFALKLNSSTGQGLLSLSPGTQPANALAPQGAIVPFTTFTLTNNGSSDVSINSFTIQRVGLSSDKAFHEVELSYDNGKGVNATLDANHQATLVGPFGLGAGQSKTFTISGAMAANLSAYAGQTAGLMLVAVNASAPVTGALPISGAQNTINSSLNVCYPPQTSLYGYQCWTTFSAVAVNNASSVPPQNIRSNLPNQPLGGFTMTVTGQSLTVSSLIFDVAAKSGAPNLTNVALFDQNGAVVAGPVDENSSKGQLVFNNSVTFPAGSTTYILKGKVPSSAVNGTTYNLMTNPSTQWGATIPLPNSTISMSTMTVQSGSLTISVSPKLAPQTVSAGIANVLVGQFDFDASQSAEDIRVPAAFFTYQASNAAAINGCIAYSGATQLTSGSNVINPNSTVLQAYTFTFNNALVIPKGVVLPVTIRCNVPSTSAGTFSWGLMSGTATCGTGVQSSQTICPTVVTNSGPTMTVSPGGQLTVALDAQSPSYALVGVGATGANGVTLGALRFSGTNEAMKLDRVALQMSNSSALSSPQNITQVTLWDGTTQVGTAIFAGTRFATSTLTGTVVVPANGYKVLTIKGDLAGIGINGAGTAGALIQVDYDGSDPTGTRAIGQSSGSTINQSSPSDTHVAGVRTFRSLPMVAKVSMPTSTFTAGNNQPLMRFSVAASPTGDIGLGQVWFKVNALGSTMGNGALYAFTDPQYSQSAAGFPGGLVGSFSGDKVAFSHPLGIPAGATYYFELRAAVSGVQSNAAITTSLAGDSQPALGLTLYAFASNSDSAFVWSPDSTTTSAFSSPDWANGYGVMGLPSNGLTQTITGNGSTTPITLTASPNPCTTAIGASTCTVSLSRTVPSGVTTQLWVAVDGNPATTVACAGGSTVTPIPWVVPGHTYLFNLYKTATCSTSEITGKTPDASVTISAVIPTLSASDYNLTASPNPCILDPLTKICTTTITWTVPAPINTQIWVSVPGRATSTLFACSGGPRTASQNATWITAAGDTFKLYRTVDCTSNPTAGTPEASITVTGTSTPAVPSNL